MTKYTTLLLDADDTLLDFLGAEAAAIKSVCEKYNIAYSEEIRSAYSGINLALWKKLEKGEITRQEIQLRRFEEFALFGRLLVGAGYGSRNTGGLQHCALQE